MNTNEEGAGKMPNEIQREKFYKLFQDNKEAMDVYKILTNTSYSIFLTGKAGSGKSTFIELARTLYNHVVIVVAPTGVAANNINGLTINKAFHFPPSFNLPTDEFIESIKVNRDDQWWLSQVELIIIDEISMVSSATLDCIDRLLQRVCNNNEPFGRKRVLMVGDPYQLPPIINKEDRRSLFSTYESEFFFDSKAYQRLNPVQVELKTVYRQKDEKFLAVLNNIRARKNTTNACKTLNENCCKANSLYIDPGAPPDLISICFTKDMVDQINYMQLNKIYEEEHYFRAKEYGNFRWDGIIAEKSLQLKNGARIMFLKNDPGGLYFNGTLGHINEIEEHQINVTTDEGNTFWLPPSEWETWNREYYKGKDGWTSRDNKVGSMVQFPIRLAWAITVHKSQGLTFDHVYLINNEMSFAPGQVYVALSRCRTMEGLRLFSHLTRRKIIVHTKIIAFYKNINDRKRIMEILEEIDKRDE